MQVEIFGDVLCPWCYIGKRRLETALDGLAERDRVEVVWRSYELGARNRTPGPTAGDELGEMWGDQAGERLALIRRLGEAEGLELNLHRARPVSTFDAHRLIHLGAARGHADDVLERVLRAYHTEALDIASPGVLQDVGADSGLDAGEVGEMLAGDAQVAEVRRDESRARDQAVRGVPALVIDGGAPVSGVQPPEDLRRLLEQALDGSTAGPVPRAEGNR